MPASPLATACRTIAPLAGSLCDLVCAVGRMVVAAQRRLRPVDVRTKGPGDPVTAVDLRAERRLRAALMRMLPSAGFLGEESPAAGVDREFVWVVDPIDGTSNYARGNGCHAVAVALMWRGHPVLAAVHTSPDLAVYHAVAGRGAFRNGRRLHLSVPTAWVDDRAVFGCQWFRRPDATDLDLVRRLQQHGARLRLLGSTVVQIIDVAAGRLDANIQSPGRLWDLAAAALVATEAGARCTDWNGSPIFPVVDWSVEHRPTLVAAPGTHRRLLRMLRA